jgi:hypothetical protein
VAGIDLVVVSEITLDLIPKPLIVPGLPTVRANRENPPKCFDPLKGFAEL